MLSAVPMFAGKLQAAVKSWFPRLVLHRGVLSDFGGGLAAKRAFQNIDVTAAVSRPSAIFGDILARPARKAANAHFSSVEAALPPRKTVRMPASASVGR
jgi:hypothetical protein